MRIFGNLPLQSINMDSIEDMNFSWMSLDTFYCILVHFATIRIYCLQVIQESSIAISLYLAYIMCFKLMLLYGSVNVRILLLKIQEFDRVLTLLKGKTPYYELERARKTFWMSMVVIILTVNFAIWCITIDDIYHIIFQMMVNSPLTLYLFLYPAICIALIVRLKYICSECQIHFNEPSRSNHDTLNPSLPLLKIRHLHLNLIECFSIVNRIFWIPNLMFSISVYTSCFVAFAETSVLIKNEAGIPKYVYVFSIMSICRLLHYISFCVVNERIRTEVRRQSLYHKGHIGDKVVS